MARYLSPAQRTLAIAMGMACSLLLLGCGGDGGGSASSASTDSSASTQPPGSGLSVTVDPPQAAPGETIEARVVNEGEEEFTYGAAYELERRTSEGLKPVDLPDRPVIQVAYIARPGEAGPPVRVKLPADLEPGTYRVVIQRDVPGVGDLSGELEITSR